MAFFNSKKTAAETPIPEVMEEHTLDDCYVLCSFCLGIARLN